MLAVSCQDWSLSSSAVISPVIEAVDFAVILALSRSKYVLLQVNNDAEVCTEATHIKGRGNEYR